MLSEWVIYLVSGIAILILMMNYFLWDYLFARVDAYRFDSEIVVSAKGSRYVRVSYNYSVDNHDFSSVELIAFPEENSLDDFLQDLTVEAFKYYPAQSRVISSRILENKRKQTKQIVLLLLALNALVFIVGLAI